MRNRLKILLAEDDPRDLEIVKHALQRNGVAVDIEYVRDGEEAICYLKGKPPFSDRVAHPFPDLIIVDLKMPRVSGLEVFEWRRHQPRCARVPLIMLSGSGLQKDIDTAYRLGANSYFSKPASLEKLQEILHSVLDYWGNAEFPEVSGQQC